MIVSRSCDAELVAVKAIQGQPMQGGDLLVKSMLSGDEMSLMEVHFAAGVGSAMHVHDHESMTYVVSGKVSMTVGDAVHVLGPGDVCRHPRNVPHCVEAIEATVMIEVKAPVPEINQLFETA